jgi:DNA processing protein
MPAEANRREIAREDPLYPQALEDLDSKDGPPERLHVLGNADCLGDPLISIIGARRATPYGLAVSEMCGRISAECGLTVVSGGAIGCDSAAARAALGAGGRTIVVAGCGADEVYPSASRDVFERAVSQGGCVVSIERWGAPPMRYTFLRRNAVIAALGKVLLIAEASRRSGTFSTATAAVQLQRSVFCAPGSIFSPNSTGTNGLIEQGAGIIAGEESLDVVISMNYGLTRATLSGAGDLEQNATILALVASPSRPEELAWRLGTELLTTIRTLSELEAKGKVCRLPDGRYSPTSAYLAQSLPSGIVIGKGLRTGRVEPEGEARRR